MPGVIPPATPRSGERRAGAALLALLAAALVAAPLLDALSDRLWAAFAAGRGGPSDFPELCGVKVVFGIPCPFCGGFRATAALGRGDFFGAFRWNPGAALLHGWLAATGALLVVRKTPPWFRAGRAALAAGLAALAANWAYLLIVGR